MTSAPVVRRFASRQALFFLLAIVVPCALLIVLTVGMIVQDAEITRTRAEEQKRRLAADVRQELLARLERMGSRATGPEVVFVARVARGQLILPWEDDPAVRAATSELQGRAFRQALEAGERHEASGAYREALDVYRSVEAASRGGLQRATAQRNAARVLAKSGRTTAARQAYLRLLDTPPAVVDDQGIPMVLWAARGLTGLPFDAPLNDRIAAALAGILELPLLPPAALYVTRDVVQLLDASTLSRRTSARLEDVERASDLQQRSAAVTSVLDEGSPHGRWRSFGDPANPWFVGPGPDAAQLVVVRAGPLLDDLHTLGGAPLGVFVAPAGEGESLAPAFPQLVLRFPREAPATLGSDARIRQSMYLAVLVVVLCMAMSGAYLFSRDVRRELRTAEMRSQFVSGVSHELKTPLTAIRMLSETLLLRRAPRPEARDEYLETIVQECERLTRLVNNLLDFSKIEQGTKTYRLEPCSPEAIVHAAARAMEYPLAQQGFELRVRIDDDLPPVLVDADAVQQALLNLLSNAVKYSGDGRLIELTLTRDGDAAVFSVSDAGIGIPTQEQPRIFEKFYRVRSVETQRITGTGLGLTLVHHVASAHGGTVRVRSAPGAGSTFSIRLPLAGEPSHAVERRGTARMKGAGTRVTLDERSV